MRNVKAVFLYVVLILTGLALWASAEEFHTVHWVDDGDTIVLDDGAKIRYIGINAPEIAHDNLPAEPFGPEASLFNRKLVLHQAIRLQLDRERTDRFQRVLAYVFLKDGAFVNQELVRSGLAHVLYVSPNIACNALLLKTQQEAMTAGKGMWRNWRETPDIYIGNKRSRRFHLKTCPLGRKTSSGNRAVFHRKWDAFFEGYAPCKVCMPAGAMERQ